MDNLKDALNDKNDNKKMDHFWIHFLKYWLSSDKFIDSIQVVILMRIHVFNT